MSLDPQKNFYDEKRYFQGKDNPGDPHPAPEAGGITAGQLIFGVLFLAMIGLLFALRVKMANEELAPATPAKPAAAAKPAAH